MAETAVLELPTFKGRAGWEFTELGDFSLEAWEPAPAVIMSVTSPWKVTTLPLPATVMSVHLIVVEAPAVP